MPDDKGNLLPEERAEALAWLNKKTTPQPCVFCQESRWALAGVTVTLLLYHGDAGLRLGGPSMPALPVICANCGHIEFFSPIAMNLIKSTTSDSKADSEKEVDDAS